MKRAIPITALFLDIGGVLLTDGWDRHIRQRAATNFKQVVYIKDTPMFVQVAESLGIRNILHTDFKSTRAKLVSFGLQNDEKGSHETI